jgi:hypothetical protein
MEERKVISTQKKHSSHEISNDPGIMILIKSVRRNAFFPILDNFESISNITEGSDLHQEKHSPLKIS